MVLTYSSGSSDGLPEEASPESYLAGIDPTPTQWVTVLHNTLDGRDFGVSSYLTSFVGRERALSEIGWIDWGLGNAGVWEKGDESGFHDGLADEANRAEFFVQRRRHDPPGIEPTTEFTPSFLWYFSAIPRPNGSWYYLDDAGRDQDLVRIQRTSTDFVIEIAAIPLRRYLAARERFLVVQCDKVVRLYSVPEPRIAADLQTETSRFGFHSGSVGSSDRPGFVRLLGKHLVLPIDAKPADLGYPYPTTESFPEFVIDTDAATGQPIVSTCEPEKLSDYFEDRGTPRYLTPVYFRREVLRRYTTEPSRFTVGARRLTCLNLWGLSFGRNGENLIEAWLGDLGRDLPSAERSHWLSFNVPPRGGIDEARHRRDILGQWVDGPPDPLARLAQARERFSFAFSALLGQPVYRAWEAADRIAFEALHLPTSSEQSEADSQILTLAKGVIEYLDTKALRKLPGTDLKAATINNLDNWVKHTGGDTDILVGPLRTLQNLRSNGVAHVRTKRWASVLTEASLDQLQPDEQFVRLVDGAADALEALAEHAAAQAQQSDPA